MKGVQIFRHALLQVVNNLGPAIRISAALYLVQVLVGLAFGRAMMSGGMGMMGGGFGLGALLVLIVSLVTGIWIAIAWHRFVLLGEVTDAPVPPFMGERMGAYFVKSLVIGLVMMALGMVLGAIVGVIGMPLMAHGAVMSGLLLMSLLVQVPLIYLGLSLAAALPGTALSNDLPLLAGWEATKDDWKTLLQLAFIMALAVTVLNLIGWMVLGGATILAQIWQVIIGWPIMMVGLSVLTTLYGHYIEKRPLV
jgi:hypothetical protein